MKMVSIWWRSQSREGRQSTLESRIDGGGVVIVRMSWVGFLKNLISGCRRLFCTHEYIKALSADKGRNEKPGTH